MNIFLVSTIIRLFYRLCFLIKLRRQVAIIMLSAFTLNAIGPLPSVKAQEFHLPPPGVMVNLSPPLDPAILKGIKVYPDNPLSFDFILDRGDDYNRHPEQSEGSHQEEVKTEATKLIKYFLAGLTIPENDLWVNLSPYEKDRIIPQSFGLTEMGRDLLAEDYMLKQITASLVYPEGAVGQRFWKSIYEQAAKRYGTTNIPVNTFNKVWIIPEKAVVYENMKVGTAYVIESKLKVMLEEDYLSLRKHVQLNTTNTMHNVASQVVRDIVIPELTREVNEDKNFAKLRQIYNSLILAIWYKKKIRESLLEQVYADQKKVAGIGYGSTHDVELIYQRYLKAFKKGVYNYIKEEQDPITQELIPRKYFSGGMQFFNLAMNTVLTTSTTLSGHLQNSNLNDVYMTLGAYNVVTQENPAIKKFRADLKADIFPDGYSEFDKNAKGKLVKSWVNGSVRPQVEILTRSGARFFDSFTGAELKHDQLNQNIFELIEVQLKNLSDPLYVVLFGEDIIKKVQEEKALNKEREAIIQQHDMFLKANSLFDYICSRVRLYTSHFYIRIHQESIIDNQIILDNKSKDTDSLFFGEYIHSANNLLTALKGNFYEFEKLLMMNGQGGIGKRKEYIEEVLKNLRNFETSLDIPAQIDEKEPDIDKLVRDSKKRAQDLKDNYDQFPHKKIEFPKLYEMALFKTSKGYNPEFILESRKMREELIPLIEQICKIYDSIVVIDQSSQELSKLPVRHEVQQPMITQMVSPAMTTIGANRNGGIDLTPANLNLQMQHAGVGIKFHLNPAMLQKLQNAQGLVPVVISIRPVDNLGKFLGISEEKTSESDVA